MAMKKPASANAPSTKRIAEPAAELKSEEEKIMMRKKMMKMREGNRRLKDNKAIK